MRLGLKNDVVADAVFRRLRSGRHNPFYVCDLGAITAKYRQFCDELPGVTPYYGRFGFVC